MTDMALVISDPQSAIQQVIDRNTAIDMLYEKVMIEKLDYGKIPGSKKSGLFKAGAEKLCSLFGLEPEYVEIRVSERFEEPYLFNYVIECRLIHIETGKVVGTGRGSCNSMEEKYRFRKAERVCPKCNTESIIKGKAEYGGGWLCFAKKGGCGAKFSDGDHEIEAQIVGRVANDDVCTLANTILKIGCKRAYVAATLSATGASSRFLQDTEDIPQRMIRQSIPTEDIVDADVVEGDESQSSESNQSSWVIPGYLAFLNNKYKMDQAAIEKLLGKPLSSFSNSSEANKAIDESLANEKPAMPKTNPNPPKEKPKNEWWKNPTDYDDVINTVARWKLTIEESLKKLGDKTLSDFNNKNDFQQQFRGRAIEGCWPVLVTKAAYKETNNGKVIDFDTPLGSMRYFSRRKFVEQMNAVGLATVDWSPMESWELGNHELPEPIFIVPKMVSGKLEIDKFEAVAAGEKQEAF